MRDDPFFKNTFRKTIYKESHALEFPILYYDCRILGAYFATRTESVRKLLPHSNFKLIETWPGTVMIGIGAFEYRDTTIGPYNEIAIFLPIKFPPGFVFPFVTAIAMARKGITRIYFSYIPVTTEVAMEYGIHFFNYPKFLSDITFQDKGDNLEVIVKEKEEMILKLNSKKLPLNRSQKFEIHAYSIKNNEVIHGLTEFWAPKLGLKIRGTISEIELGQHRISKELAELNISETAKGVIYAEGAMMKLHEPDQRWNVDTLEAIKA